MNLTEEQIEENNKLIALFMGWSFGIVTGWLHGSREGCYKKDEQGEITDFYSIYNLKYHSDWNRLMPVVEKIERIKPFYSVSNSAAFWYDDETDTEDRSRIQYLCIISDNRSRIRINSANYYPERESKIIATWYAVVEFIKWYNSQNNLTPQT